jgi:branched-chain amino acid transport system substrate-binding protein
MTITGRILGCALAALAVTAARAEDPQPIKIGILTSMSTYGSDVGGPGSVVAAQMAIDNFGGKVLGRPITILTGDTQQKPDVAASIASQWYDQAGVDAIFDVPQSAVALAVWNLANTRHKIVFTDNAGTMGLSGKQCSATGFQWTFDTYSLAHSTGRAEVQAGGKTWFLIYADFAFGYDLLRDATNAIDQAGGQVVGKIPQPTNTPDLSSFVLTAMSSSAQVIGLANAPPDNLNAVKVVHNFGGTDAGKKVAVFLLQADDVHSLGLPVAQNLLITEPFYWDQNDNTRAFSKRYDEKMHMMPSAGQAGVYSSVTAWLHAVQATNTTDGPTVAKQIHETPVNDPLYQGHVLPDGRMAHAMYLFQVKTPAESKSPWDYYKLLKTIPADEAFPAANDRGCPLVAAK